MKSNLRICFLLISAIMLASLTNTAMAQNPGDYVIQWTYGIQTPYQSGSPASNLQNPFCAGPNPDCYFTEKDVFAGSTTTTEVDVWTSTTIGPAIVNNNFNAHAMTQIDEYIFVNSSGYWNAVTSSTQPIESEPTARAPQTGVLSYILATPGNYYGQSAWHCADNTVIYYYACFDTWFPTYNETKLTTNQWYYDGAPQVNTPSPAPGNGPGSSGTITVTGAHFVDPFQGSGAVGVNPVPGDSRLSLNVNSWSVNSTTGVETVVVSYSVSSNASPGASSFKFKDHFGSSVSIPFNVLPPPVVNGSDGKSITSSQSSPIQVLAGAPISLSVAAPSGQTIQSQTWSFGTPGDMVANFNATSKSGGPVAVTNKTSSSLNCFFIVPGRTETVTVSVTYSGGATASTTEWYSVGGPTGNILPNVFTQGNNSGTLILDSPNGNPNPNANPATMQMGNAPLNPHVGIWFNDLPTLPTNSGSFVWVQILNSVTYSQLFQNGVGYNPPSDIELGLDGEYPYLGGEYSPNKTTSDAPGRTDLYSFLGEAGESFDATMYVLWDPTIPPSGQTTCTAAWIDTTTQPYTPNPSTCASIPVPLASVEWTWSACAINSLSAGPNSAPAPSWAVNCGKGGYAQPVASGYPTWTTCDASKFGKCE